MTTLSKLDEARLRELAEAATPGPWVLDGYQCVSAPDGRIVVDYSCHSRGEWEADGNYFLAVQPAAVLALLDALSAERERADRAVADKADMQRRLDLWEPKLVNTLSIAVSSRIGGNNAPLATQSSSRTGDNAP